jgi:hypothetical protein
VGYAESGFCLRRRLSSNVRRLTERLVSGGSARPVEMGDFVGFKIVFGTEDGFWRQWYLRHEKLGLFVTYHRSAAERGVEDAVVELILTTLSALKRDAA